MQGWQEMDRNSYTVTVQAVVDSADHGRGPSAEGGQGVPASWLLLKAEWILKGCGRALGSTRGIREWGLENE